MKSTLKPGDKAQFSYQVPASKTVPHLYPEAVEFAMMPKVFATGFMVGLMEWTCMKCNRTGCRRLPRAKRRLQK